MADNCKLKADAIIFDKDGTLIDFDTFWVSVSDAAIKKVLAQLHQVESLAGKILRAIGVHDGVTDIDGVLCYGTYGQIAEVVYQVLAQHGCPATQAEVEKLMVDAYEESVDAGEVQATCSNLREVLTVLKEQGKKLAVITTDNVEVTAFCLEKLGIADLFDKIYADGCGLPAKPHPDSAFDFCAFANADKDHVVMVGDTMTDIRFARNAGIHVISVAKSETNRQLLLREAQTVIHDVSGLLDVLV